MKILIIRFSSLGDIVLAEPLIRALKNIESNEVHFLTKSLYANFVMKHFAVSKVWIWEDKLKLIKLLKLEFFDVVIDIQSKLNSIIVKKSIRAKKILTYKKFHFLRKLMLKKMTNRRIESVAKLYFDTLKQIGIETKFSNPKLEVGERRLFFQEICEKFEIPQKRTLIGIFPGATYFTKQYPTEMWKEFLNEISETWKCSFIILGSHKEKLISRQIVSKVKQSVFDLTGAFNLENLVDFMTHLDGFISNDSGPMHIIAALNKPQIAIFGATHPKLGFAPLNKKAKIMVSEIRCQPCSLHGDKQCPKKHFNCMRKLPVIDLYDNFKKMLEDNIWKF